MGKLSAHFAGSKVLKSSLWCLIVFRAWIWLFETLPPSWQVITQTCFKYSSCEILHLYLWTWQRNFFLPPVWLLSLRSLKTEIMFCFPLEFVPQNVLVVSREPAQPRAFWLLASCMSQDCLEHDPEWFRGAFSLNGHTWWRRKSLLSGFRIYAWINSGRMDENDISNIHGTVEEIYHPKLFCFCTNKINRARMGIASLALRMKAHGWHRKRVGAEPDRWACSVKCLRGN